MSHGARNRSRDANEHLGFLIQWVAETKRAGHFSLWSHEELLSQAFLTASELLEKNYRPEKGTVITYLRNFLWARVAYAYGKYHGWRYRKSKWVILESFFDAASHKGCVPHDKAELPSDLTEREIDVILMKVGGMTHKAIAEAYGYKSPTTVSYWIRHHIYPKFQRAGIIERDRDYI